MDPDACAEAEEWRRDLEENVGEVAVSDVMESYDLDPVTAKAGEMTECWNGGSPRDGVCHGKSDEN